MIGTVHEAEQTLGVCSLLSLNNKQSDTTPVSSWPPLWPDWYRVEAAGSTLKDTQPVDHILSSDTQHSLHNGLHHSKGVLSLLVFFFFNSNLEADTVCWGNFNPICQSNKDEVAAE